MTTEFSKLDTAKLDLIRLKSQVEDLSDMTLRDVTQINILEADIVRKTSWIRELHIALSVGILVQTGSTRKLKKGIQIPLCVNPVEQIVLA